MKALTLVFLVAAAVLVGGCAPGSQALTLDGREFLSVAVTEGGADRPLVGDTRIRLRFSDGNFSAQAGCNTMGADYEVRDGRLVADGGAMTEMGCDAPRHAQDDWLFGFIGSRPAIQLAAERLVLNDGTTAIAFLDREAAEPDLGLVGPTWSVDSIVFGDAVASLAPDTHATIQFAADGRAVLWTGCNEGGAKVLVEGDKVLFTELVLTDRACPGDAGRLEADVLRVLRTGALTVRLEANRLELVAPGTGLNLVAGSGID